MFSTLYFAAAAALANPSSNDAYAARVLDGRFAEAVALVAARCDSQPGDAAADVRDVHAYADIQLVLGRFEEAEDTFRRAQAAARIARPDARDDLPQRELAGVLPEPLRRGAGRVPADRRRSRGERRAEAREPRRHVCRHASSRPRRGRDGDARRARRGRARRRRWALGAARGRAARGSAAAIPDRPRRRARRSRVLALGARRAAAGGVRGNGRAARRLRGRCAAAAAHARRLHARDARSPRATTRRWGESTRT